MMRIPVPPTLPPAQPIRHKVACKNCPSAHFAPDPEVLDILKWPHAERIKTAFPCGWNGKRYCKGYCDQMGITDADLAREFDRAAAQPPSSQHFRIAHSYLRKVVIMSENKFGAIVVTVIALVLGSLILADHWSRVDDENNAFAKDCNNRGGTAIYKDGMRQCIGAKVAAKGGEHD